MDVTIVSTDKDFLQLVDGRINVWSPIKKKLYDKAAVLEEFGVLSENFILWKAIVGDESDDVKGVHGVGGKSVPKMFPFLGERAATLDDVVKHADTNRSAGKRFVSVAESGPILTRNLELMALRPPTISAASMRSAREQLSKKQAFRPFELKMRMMRDGISLTDQDFVQQLTVQHAREESDKG
jgi:5'-3' exonuclease